METFPSLPEALQEASLVGLLQQGPSGHLVYILIHCPFRVPTLPWLLLLQFIPSPSFVFPAASCYPYPCPISSLGIHVTSFHFAITQHSARSFKGPTEAWVVTDQSCEIMDALCSVV
jgi:hypothetical protein